MENVVADYDVVIVRAPACRRDLAARLASIPSHALVPADYLCYWSWEWQRFTPVAAPDGFCLEETTDVSELAPLVRDALCECGNRYRANPLPVSRWCDVSVAAGISSFVVICQCLKCGDERIVDTRGDAPAVFVHLPSESGEPSLSNVTI